MFFKLLNCQYFHWFQNINTEKTTSKSLLNLRQYPHCLLKIWELQGIPWQSCDWDSEHPLKEAQVPSLVRELRSQKLSNSTRKKKNQGTPNSKLCLYTQNGSLCVFHVFSFQMGLHVMLWMTMLKFLWITTTCGKFLKRWEYQTTLPVS